MASDIKVLVEEQVRSFARKVRLIDGSTQENEKVINLILCVIDRLKSYQEEGKDLRPDFYIFREHDQLNLKKEIEASHLFEINSAAEMDEASVDQAIKQCAPLAHGVWAGFIKIKSSGIAYGVMRRRYSITEQTILSGTLQVSTPFIRIRQTEKLVIELTGAGAAEEEVCFQLTRNVSESASEKRDQLLDALTEKCWPTKRAAVRSILEDVLDRALMNGHGFLIAVTESSDEKAEPATRLSFLKGIYFRRWLIPTQLKIAELLKWQMRGTSEEKIEIEKRLSTESSALEVHAKNVTARYAEVSAWSDLIVSMLMSDGITLFDNRGRVLGFRLFISSSKDEQAGGARTRAFAALAEKVQKSELKTAFMQSQDGRTKFIKWT